MFFRKNRQIVFFLFVFCGLSAQNEEKEPRSFLFGLIKLDKQSKYEDALVLFMHPNIRNKNMHKNFVQKISPASQEDHAKCYLSVDNLFYLQRCQRN